MKALSLLFCLALLSAGGAFAQQKAPGAAPAKEDAQTSATAAYAPIPKAELDKLLDKISVRLGAVRSFRSRFTQERHLALFMDVLRTSGTCYFQAPDRFRWELTAPYSSVLIFNHDKVAKFELSQNQLKYIQSGAYDVIKGLMGQMTGWMRGDFKESAGAFTLSVLNGPDWRLIMTPRSSKMSDYIKTIELSMDKQKFQVSRIVIREPEEDFIEITFFDTRENVPLDSGVFDVQHPSTMHGDHDSAK